MQYVYFSRSAVNLPRDGLCNVSFYQLYYNHHCIIGYKIVLSVLPVIDSHKATENRDTVIPISVFVLKIFGKG